MKITYPEIKQFIDDYIRGSQPLPVEEYMEQLGFKYIEEKPSEDMRPSLGAGMTLNSSGEIAFANVSDNAKKYGLRIGDVLIEAFGQEVNLGNIRDIISKSYTMNVGDAVNLVVKRGDEKIELTAIFSSRIDRHVFEDMKTLTEQKFLREQWLKNL